MNYIEKLDNNKIGFTFITDYLITRRTFENVSLESFPGIHKELIF
jgi:hypothetical protein